VSRARSPDRSRRRRTSEGGVKIGLGQIIGEFVTGTLPTTEDGYFYACPGCGQAVDERDLAQIIHHEMIDHKPMKLPRRLSRFGRR
jgi:hypothetical protein